MAAQKTSTLLGQSGNTSKTDHKAELHCSVNAPSDAVWHHSKNSFAWAQWEPSLPVTGIAGGMLFVYLDYFGDGYLLYEKTIWHVLIGLLWHSPGWKEPASWDE